MALRYDFPNITSENVSNNQLEFDFQGDDIFIYHGSSVELTLATSPRVLIHNTISLSPYTPPKNNLEFELGFDTTRAVVGTNSAVNSTSYNLIIGEDLIGPNNYGLAFGQISNAISSFSETNYDIIFDNDSISSTNYDIEMAQVFDTIIFSNSWDFASVFVGSGGARSDLATTKNLVNNLDVCGIPFEPSVTAQYEFKFDDFAPCQLEFEYDSMFHGSVVDVNITVDKNTNIDISPCSVDVNPKINISPHNFDFTPGCDFRIVSIFNGASVSFEIVETLDFGEALIFHGAYNDADLTTQTLFDTPIYHGASNAFDLAIFPPALIDSDAFHGGNVNADLWTSVILDPPIYHGASNAFEIEVFPPALIDSDAFHGATVDSDLETSIQFSSDSYHGAAVIDFDLDISPAIDLILDFYHGQYSESSLASSILFAPSIQYGAYADTDFTRVPPIEFELDISHGAAALDTDIVYAKVLYPRGYHGAGVVTDLVLPPPIEFEMGISHGAAALDTDIVPSDFNTHMYHGAAAEVATLNITTTFSFDILDGASSAVEINPTLALYAVGYSGAYGDCDLEAVLGFEFEFTAYNGANGTIDELDVQQSPILTPEVISTGAIMYDGLGGYGGINHCLGASKFITIGYGDFNIDFDYHGYDNAWSFCPTGWTTVSADLTTNQRFEFDAYAGSSVEVFIPSQFIELELDVIGHGSSILIRTDSFEYTRFCRGYIIPTGASVAFEYTVEETYDCESVTLSHGQNTTFELHIEQVFSDPDIILTGARILPINLIIKPPILYEIFHGPHASAAMSTDVVFSIAEESSFFYGSSVSFEFDVIGDYGYHGASASLDELIVPGPGIRWVTDAGVLPNQFVPLDDQGFPKLELTLPDENGVIQVLPLATEEVQFRTNIVAECFIISL